MRFPFWYFWMMCCCSKVWSFCLMMRRLAVPRLALTKSVIWLTFCSGRSKRTRMMSLLIGSLRSGRMASGVSPPWSRRRPASLRVLFCCFSCVIEWFEEHSKHLFEVTDAFVQLFDFVGDFLFVLLHDIRITREGKRMFAWEDSLEEKKEGRHQNKIFGDVTRRF